MFWITEAGALYRFDNADAIGYNDEKLFEKLYYSWELGLMGNLDNRNAVGGTMYLGFDNFLNDTRIGFKARYRRWLASRFSLDFAPGLITSKKADRSGFVASIGINHNDTFVLAVQLEILKWKKTGETDYIWYGGLRAGSYPGIAMAAIFAFISIFKDKDSFISM
jgi:hypothetical protein